MELSDTFKKRCEANFFRNETLSQETFLSLVDAAHFAHSIGNRQLLRYVLVKDETKASEVYSFVNMNFPGSKVELNDEDSVSPSAYIVLTAPKHLDATIYADAGSAYQSIAMQAVEFGVSCLWVRYYNNDALQELLEVPHDENIIAVIALGEAHGHQTVEYVDSDESLWPTIEEDYNCSVPKLKSKYLVRWY